MPQRIVRPGLLDSPGYLAVSDAAARVFLALILTADDLGNAEAAPGTIARHMDNETRDRKPSRDEAAAVLAELAKADLIRLYLSDKRQYAHIPRWRQRLRSYRRTHPRPPAEIECSEMKHLMSKLSDNSQADDGQPQANDGLREGKGREGLSSNGGAVDVASGPAVDNSAAAAVKLPGGWWRTDAGIEAAGRLTGIKAQAGDTYSDWKRRIFEARGKA